jgi:Excreted virulence factor EspC, type VII ESX diderm
MNHLADTLERGVDALAMMQARLPHLTVPVEALAPDESGLPGHLGRSLHSHWSAVLSARSREAASAAARLSELAAAVRTAQDHYTSTDEAAAARLRRDL